VPFRKHQKIDLIKSVPLFSGLSKSELGHVAQLADEVDVPEGKELIAEGDRGRQFFVLVEGSANVRRRGRKVNTMGPGDFFGEIALVSDRPTTASVTTAEPSRLLVVTAPSFRGLLRDSQGVQLKVLQALAERVPD
jgi:CRP/FNR family transcriptional regulator, cyclic AMP receptor protein